MSPYIKHKFCDFSLFINKQLQEFFNFLHINQIYMSLNSGDVSYNADQHTAD